MYELFPYADYNDGYTTVIGYYYVDSNNKLRLYHREVNHISDIPLSLCEQTLALHIKY